MANLDNMNDGASESGGLSYQMEQPDRGLELDMSALPPSGVSMGGDTATDVLAGSDSNQGGAQGGMDAMSGLDGLGSRYFSDGEKPYDTSGFDSMRGVVGLDGIHVEQLSGADVYAIQLEPTFEFPLGETGNPLIEPD